MESHLMKKNFFSDVWFSRKMLTKIFRIVSDNPDDNSVLINDSKCSVLCWVTLGQGKPPNPSSYSATDRTGRPAFRGEIGFFFQLSTGKCILSWDRKNVKYCNDYCGFFCLIFSWFFFFRIDSYSILLCPFFLSVLIFSFFFSSYSFSFWHSFSQSSLFFLLFHLLLPLLLPPPLFTSSCSFS